MTDKTIPFSVLDLAPIPQGSSAREAFTHSLDLARLAEKRGYHRYWLAEHHNMVGIASAATSVLIGYLAANTTTLHLGSGGVMLPNHAPLVIAEQFGTLNTLYPGRIDLGLGRAPGSDQPTMRALPLTFLRKTLATVVACALTACSTLPAYKVPETAVPDRYAAPTRPAQAASGWAVATPVDTQPRGDWWKVFNDPELNQLEDQLPVSNQSVQKAVAQLQQARALIDYQHFQYEAAYQTLAANVVTTAIEEAEYRARTGGGGMKDRRRRTARNTHATSSSVTPAAT